MFVSSELEKTSGKKFETASADGDCGISIKIARRWHGRVNQPFGLNSYVA